MLPRIISATGAAITPDEITAVQRVISTRSLQHAGIYRVKDELTGVLVEYHPYKNTAYTTPSGATDYVAMLMPNPIPYRGVSIGVLDKAVGRYEYVDENPNPIPPAGQVVYRSTCTYTVSVDGVDVFSTTGTFEYIWTTTGYGVQFVWTNWPGGGYIIYNGGAYGAAGYSYTTYMNTTGNGLTWPVHTDAMAIPDSGKPTTYVMVSDGTVLASEAQNTPQQNHIQYIALEDIWGIPWGGGSKTRMYDNDSRISNYFVYDHDLTWTTPEDCIYPIPQTNSPTVPWSGVSVTPAEQAAWDADWAAGIAAFNLRRRNWFKKNSDEFIAALKTGFAANAAGVTRAELKQGRLPESWDFRIKRDVDNKYANYPPEGGEPMPPWWNPDPDEDGTWFGGGIVVGQHTSRPIQYSEVAWSETVESDTSAGLSQAGVMVTKRESTLQYTVGAEVRTTVLTGYLTQTVTDHFGRDGSWLGISRRDVYDNWYNREEVLPGQSISKTAPYIEDLSNTRMGVVLNGYLQQGYNADSSLGIIGNPLDYAGYVPPYPKESIGYTAAALDFIKTWHKDAPIIYAKDGVGASNILNDSAMHGVTEVHISPIGLIADGAGTAPAGTHVGIFSDGEDGSQVELYGTAIYKFDWQEGSLTFKSWKPLHDANGNEVASKVVSLPAGLVLSDSPNNCIVTYKGLHWPDVVAALKLRDADAASGTFVYSDAIWKALRDAIKAG